MWDKVLVIILVSALTYFSKNKNAGYIIKFYLCFGIFYAASILVAIVIWPSFLFDPKNVRNAKKAAGILKHISKICGPTWILRNGEILAVDRGAVVVSNHQSALDILGMYNIWHIADKISAIAKKELLYVFPFGPAAYLAGVVFIDRSNPKNAYKQLQITSDVMIKNKTKLWLFPEGTRNKDYTSMLPFKKGAFKIAIAAQVPIIPVVFSPYYFIDRKKYISNKGHIIIQCLEPVPTAGLTQDDIPQLTERVRDLMMCTYKELWKEVRETLPADYLHTLKGE